MLKYVSTEKNPKCSMHQLEKKLNNKLKRMRIIKDNVKLKYECETSKKTK